jgi:hypothetical protein
MSSWWTKIPERHRFWLKVYPRGDCWEWRGARSRNYGAFNGIVRVASRYAYMEAKGDIPAPLQIDHLCHHPWCVRPSHLQAVTARENTLRGWGRTQLIRRTGKCIHGHPQDAVNVYYRKDRPGQRMCRACVRERLSRYHREGRLAGRPPLRVESVVCRCGQAFTVRVGLHPRQYVWCADCRRSGSRRARIVRELSQ